MINSKKKSRFKKRYAPKISIAFPAAIAPNFLGEGEDADKFSVDNIFEKPVLVTRAEGVLELKENNRVARNFNVLWSKRVLNYKGLKYIPAFIRIKETDLNLLIDATFNTYKLNHELLQIVRDFTQYLASTKKTFDEFDKQNPSFDKQIDFIERNKKSIFKSLDKFSGAIWQKVRAMKTAEYNMHQRYLQFMIYHFFCSPSEIISHIYRKPLGYSGDFMMMNYIFDYHSYKYLGNSSYAKLMNNYACNIPVSCSNISRKDYLKKQINEIALKKADARILSVGCGSAREVTELLESGAVLEGVKYSALDFEDRALDFLKNKIDSINPGKNNFSIQYYKYNIKELIKNTDVLKHIGENDLIYLSGVLDYMTDDIATKIIKSLIEILPPKGRLIAFNISDENDGQRGFYEFFGGWYMYHRKKQDIENWIKNIDSANIKTNFTNCGNYWLLEVDKV